jgi:tetratricopeptide (TPR) repeat protein
MDPVTLGLGVAKLVWRVYTLVQTAKALSKQRQNEFEGCLEAIKSLYDVIEQVKAASRSLRQQFKKIERKLQGLDAPDDEGGADVAAAAEALGDAMDEHSTMLAAIAGKGSDLALQAASQVSAMLGGVVPAVSFAQHIPDGDAIVTGARDKVSAIGEAASASAGGDATLVVFKMVPGLLKDLKSASGTDQTIAFVLISLHQCSRAVESWLKTKREQEKRFLGGLRRDTSQMEKDKEAINDATKLLVKAEEKLRLVLEVSMIEAVEMIQSGQGELKEGQQRIHQSQKEAIAIQEAILEELQQIKDSLPWSSLDRIAHKCLRLIKGIEEVTQETNNRLEAAKRELAIGTSSDWRRVSNRAVLFDIADARKAGPPWPIVGRLGLMNEVQEVFDLSSGSRASASASAAASSAESPPSTAYMPSGRRIVVLEGPGGIGKSEVAVKLAQAARKTHRWVVRVNASDVDSLRLELVSACETIGGVEKLRESERMSLRSPVNTLWNLLRDLPFRERAPVSRGIVGDSERRADRMMLIFESLDDPLCLLEDMRLADEAHARGDHSLERVAWLPPPTAAVDVIITTRCVSSSYGDVGSLLTASDALRQKLDEYERWLPAVVPEPTSAAAPTEAVADVALMKHFAVEPLMPSDSARVFLGVLRSKLPPSFPMPEALSELRRDALDSRCRGYALLIVLLAGQCALKLRDEGSRSVEEVANEVIKRAVAADSIDLSLRVRELLTFSDAGTSSVVKSLRALVPSPSDGWSEVDSDPVDGGRELATRDVLASIERWLLSAVVACVEHSWPATAGSLTKHLASGLRVESKSSKLLPKALEALGFTVGPEGSVFARNEWLYLKSRLAHVRQSGALAASVEGSVELLSRRLKDPHHQMMFLRLASLGFDITRVGVTCEELLGAHRLLRDHSPGDKPESWPSDEALLTTIREVMQEAVHVCLAGIDDSRYFMHPEIARVLGEGLMRSGEEFELVSALKRASVRVCCAMAVDQQLALLGDVSPDRRPLLLHLSWQLRGLTDLVGKVPWIRALGSGGKAIPVACALVRGTVYRDWLQWSMLDDSAQLIASALARREVVEGVQVEDVVRSSLTQGTEWLCFGASERCIGDPARSEETVKSVIDWGDCWDRLSTPANLLGLFKRSMEPEVMVEVRSMEALSHWIWSTSPEDQRSALGCVDEALSRTKDMGRRDLCKRIAKAAVPLVLIIGAGRLDLDTLEKVVQGLAEGGERSEADELLAALGGSTSRVTPSLSPEGHGSASAASAMSTDAADVSSTSEIMLAQAHLLRESQELEKACELYQRWLDAADRTGHPEYASTLHNMAFCMSQKDFEVANALFETSQAIRSSGEKGSESAEYALGLHQWAHCLHHWDKPKEALDMLRECEAIQRRVLAPDDPMLALTLQDIGVCLEKKGEYDEALKMLLAAQDIFLVKLGQFHPMLALVVDNIAGCLEKKGEYSEAFELHRRALEIRAAQLGTRHLEYANSLNNVAGSLATLGEYDEALTKYQQALEIRQERLAEVHPDVLVSLNNVAGCWQSLGRPDKALTLYQECLARQERRGLAPDSLEIAMTRNNIGACFYGLREYDKALEQYKQCLGPFLGQQADPILRSALLSNMGTCFSCQSEIDSALWYLEASLQLHRDQGATATLDYAMTLNNIATCYAHRGEYDRALEHLHEVLRIRRGTPAGRNHPEYAQGLLNIAACHNRLLEFDKALPLVDEAHEIIQGLKSPQQELVLTGYSALADTLLGVAKWFYLRCEFDEAFAYFTHGLQAVEWFEGDPRVPRSQLWMANCLLGMGLAHMERAEYPLALDLFVESLSIVNTVLGPDDPAVVSPLHLIALCNQAMGDLESAVVQFERCQEIRMRVFRTNNPLQRGGDLLVAACRFGLGNHRFIEGDLDRALVEFETSGAIQERWLGTDHMVLRTTQLRIADCHLGLGNLRFAEGDLDRALVEFETSGAIQERWLGTDHMVLRTTQLRIADCHLGLGELLLERGDFEAARTKLGLCLTIRQRLRVREARIHQVERRVSDCWFQQGHALWREEQFNTALKHFEESRDIRTKLLEEGMDVREDHMKSVGGVADCHFGLGLVLAEAHEFDEAIVRFRRALQLREGLPRPHIDRARALHRIGRCLKASSNPLQWLESMSQLSAAVTEYEGLEGVEAELELAQAREDAENATRVLVRVGGPLALAVTGLLGMAHR